LDDRRSIRRASPVVWLEAMTPGVYASHTTFVPIQVGLSHGRSGSDGGVWRWLLRARGL